MQNSSKFVYKHKNGTWYYRRRIPAHIRNFISAVRVKKSLKTTNVTIAALRCCELAYKIDPPLAFKIVPPALKNRVN